MPRRKSVISRRLSRRRVKALFEGPPDAPPEEQAIVKPRLVLVKGEHLQIVFREPVMVSDLTIRVSKRRHKRRSQ